MKNPFTPGFGNSPPVLAGRADILDQFAETIEDGPGALGRATLYTGARGTGKTVMLNEVADIAAASGWITIHETATPGFVTRLVTQHLPTLLAGLDPDAKRTNVTGIAAPLGVGAMTWDSTTPTLLPPGSATSSSWHATS